ncbi:DUF7502 family protein [Halobellus ruber]|uniref:Uncharacterized protein n=1 Tax=Halobellus ruber TaxID=2761102 RepID=A0A7J9SGP1_9EURY|nr:hypothetical protein [Halobellus ruber]MBB6646125.1 hypothetical protein [Halobellus ruber]
MSDPSDGRGDEDPVEWLEGIEWSQDPPDDGIGEAGEATDTESAATGTTDVDSGANLDSGAAETTDTGTDPDSRAAPSVADAEAATTDRIAAALAEVRSEVRKAALVHAAVEGALLAVVATLLLSLATPAVLSGTLPLPALAFEVLRGLPVIGPVAPRTVGVASLAAAGVGAAGFAGAYLLRLRRPLIEQFEAANPAVREALRTARDAVDGGNDTEMARRLYGDVIATLQETSTLELVDARRLTVTVVLVALVAIASVQVAVIDPDLGGILAGGSDPEADIEQPDDDELQDGDEILGDAEDVEAGDEVRNITVPGTGEGDGEGSVAPGGGTGAGGGSGGFDSQQAGFAGNERIEDAELVREYNLRIREFDDDGTDDAA